MPSKMKKTNLDTQTMFVDEPLRRIMGENDEYTYMLDKYGYEIPYPSKWIISTRVKQYCETEGYFPNRKASLFRITVRQDIETTEYLFVLTEDDSILGCMMYIDEICVLDAPYVNEVSITKIGDLQWEDEYSQWILENPALGLP